MSLRSSSSALRALGIGAALAAGLALPGLSSAQTAPQQLPGSPQFNRPVPPPPQFERGSAREFDRRQNRLERRLEFLRSELQITATQQSLWDAFADAVRREAEAGRGQIADRAGAFRGPRPDGRLERPGIVERLERRQQTLAEQSEHYERLLGALRPLYAALNEDQRRAADEHLFSPGREDRFRRGPQRRGGGFGANSYRDFGGDFYGAFDGPFGPFPPRYDHRLGRVYYP